MSAALASSVPTQLHATVADLGIAAQVTAASGDELQQTLMTIMKTSMMGAGTTGYMAPEVVENLRMYSSKSDVFSFGVCLAQLATGRQAYSLEGRGNTARIVKLYEELREDTRSLASQGEPGVVWEPAESLAGLLRLAIDCTKPAVDRATRPSMSDVVLALADLLNPTGGPSKFYSQPDMLTSEEPLLCICCEDAGRSTVFLPCNHSICCRPCSDDLRGRARGGPVPCPICRQPVQSVKDLTGPVVRTFQGASLGHAMDPRHKTPSGPVLLVPPPIAPAASPDRSWAPPSPSPVAPATAPPVPVLPAPIWQEEPRPQPSSFDVTLKPGQSLQAAINDVRRGGNILLLPGVYPASDIEINFEVHIWGRGQAIIRATDNDEAIISTAANATLDGLTIERTAASAGEVGGHAVIVKDGSLRVQNCKLQSDSMTCATVAGPEIDNGAGAVEPSFVDCTFVGSSKVFYARV